MTLAGHLFHVIFSATPVNFTVITQSTTLCFFVGSPIPIHLRSGLYVLSQSVLAALGDLW